MNPILLEARTKFEAQFKAKPLLAKAPGRINLIGEHTDYNEGFVAPSAIDKAIYVALGRNSLGKIRALALDRDAYEELDLHATISAGDWTSYVFGVVREFNKNGISVEGIDVVFGGDIPLGAGLSSSAALTSSLATAINHLFNGELDKWDIALMGQSVEHNYAGVQCGIMDQFASVFGKKGQIMQLDCRSREYHYFDLNLGDAQLILCDSGVKHSLADSGYNDRREDCNQGVAILKRFDDKVQGLRDVTMEMLEEHQLELPERVFRRCKYVVEENQRVLAACDAMTKGDLHRVGQLLFATHHGLSQEYEVSCKELDLLVEEAAKCEGVLGARMMGGGFGGCTINIVLKRESQSFLESVRSAYKHAFGEDLKVYQVALGDGAQIIT